MLEKPSLFQRVGGAGAVDAAVDLFYRKVLKDPRLAPFFADANMEAQRQKQKAFLTMVFGGPNTYNGRDFRTAHAGLVARGLGDVHFDAVAGHLKDTLTELGCDAAVVGEVIGVAASTRADVLNR
ncbi:MAG: group 1 truncated hemoglobin [Alphaproteobacteria bacterium]|nr:group 1 truncated hemoglobin [Alphaproteobacteria bacterium]